MMPSELNKSRVHKIKEQIKTLSLKKGADFEDVFTLFVIERAVVRLMSDEKLARSMIFKGGFVCVRVFESPRYTERIWWAEASISSWILSSIKRH